MFGLVSFLSLFVLFCQANTHTHTHTLLILLSDHHQGTHLHCNYITLFFSLFSFEIRKLYNYLFYLSGMSVLRFYFLLSAFLKIIFPLFLKSRLQKTNKTKKKQKKKGRSLMPPLSCRKSSRSFVSGQSCKARSLCTVLEI